MHSESTGIRLLLEQTILILPPPSRQPGAQMTTLPIEIILSIIDELGKAYLAKLDGWGPSIEEKHTLSTVALVCKVCRDQAYRFLHGSIECSSNDELVSFLNDEDGLANPRQPLQPQPQPQLLVHAHTLTLRFGLKLFDNGEALSSLLDRLPSLHKLVIKSDSKTSWTVRVSESLKHALLRLISSGRLTSLHLGILRVPRSLLKCFHPSLQSLYIDGVEEEMEAVEFKTPTQDERYHHAWTVGIDSLKNIAIVRYRSAPFSILDRTLFFPDTDEQGGVTTTLSPQGAEGSSNSVTRPTSSTIRFDNLESAVVWGFDFIDSWAVDTLTRDCKYLKAIEFKYGTEVFSQMQDNPLKLSSLHTLQSISIPAYLTLSPTSPKPFPKTLVHVLETATHPLPRLRSIHFKIYWSQGQWENLNTEDILAPNWNELDEALTRDGVFRGLQEVVLDMTAIRPRIWRGMDFRKLREDIKTRGLPKAAAAAALKVLF
ncbi:hypothetical protein CC2G_004122 [Coprinopsis cinerea AmutBmut pab1-1]|nr:hypothetical protein CC2G_004122 [Coprinopsis cinerea AmutBmut pab1-1]